jgi:hypothetical protein
MIRRFPEVEGPIRDGRPCVTTVSELAKVMTEENRAEVLPLFLGLSRQEAKQLVASLRPVEQVPRRTVVTEIPRLAQLPAAPVIVQPAGRDRTHPDRGMSATVQARTVVVPMTATETRIHITVSPEFLALLKMAKAGQSRVQPGATDEQVLTAALALLIEEQQKRKASVPAKVKREVRTEVDQVVPRGKGGAGGLRRRAHGPLHPEAAGGLGAGGGLRFAPITPASTAAAPRTPRRPSPPPARAGGAQRPPR